IRRTGGNRPSESGLRAGLGTVNKAFRRPHPVCVVEINSVVYTFGFCLKSIQAKIKVVRRRIKCKQRGDFLQISENKS
ncbi:hypothetical protein, partial [Kingella denitrificans]|uniref:hypothetical protein n=1 Tax=Kingella denitrificans TaxID=502 RepID=UPI0028D6691B